MSESQFDHIVDQVKPLAQEVLLHVLGEPLASPIFVHCLQRCTELKLPVQITTNGLLIKKYAQIILESSVRQVNFSLQSFIDNYPEKSIVEYLEPIFAYCDLIAATGSNQYINLRLWNVSSEQNNDYIFDLIESHFGVSLNRTVSTRKYKSKKINNNVYLHFDERFEWPSLKNKLLGTEGTCKGLINQIAIMANGNVVPCCLDCKSDLLLGNCLETPLVEIVNSTKAAAIIAGFKSNHLVESLCQHCSYCRRFKKIKE